MFEVAFFLLAYSVGCITLNYGRILCVSAQNGWGPAGQIDNRIWTHLGSWSIYLAPVAAILEYFKVI